MTSLSDYIRILIARLPEGEVKSIKRTSPDIKPPRRKSLITNKSNKPEYMRDYMKEYREEGKDYQKVPKKVKEWRKEQRDCSHD